MPMRKQPAWGTDKQAVICELASKMADEGYIDDGEKLIEEALRREAILSTAVAHGLAFPHARGIEGGGLTLALGLSRKGVKFDGEAGKTRMVFFMAIPIAASAFYLKLLAGLAETFAVDESRAALLEAKDAKALWKTLNKLTRKTIK